MKTGWPPGTGNHKGCPYNRFAGAYFHRNDCSGIPRVICARHSRRRRADHQPEKGEPEEWCVSMPQLKADHMGPTDEEEAEIQRQIVEDPDDSAHWGSRSPARPRGRGGPGTRGMVPPEPWQAKGPNEGAGVHTPGRRHRGALPGRREGLADKAKRHAARGGYRDVRPCSSL